jgi:glycosyltransferase involved in cell wall biosynthesis
VLRAVVDARDTRSPELRGWGRYAAALIGALEQHPDVDVQRVERGWPGPELLFELAGLPLKARGADVLHVPNCFLPPRRPCPGVVTVHDLAFEDHPEDFAATTGWKYRTLTPRAARSAERVITPSEFTRDDLVTRYRVDPEKIRVIREAPALPLGNEPPPEGPYLLAVGDLRRKKNFARLASAFLLLHSEGLPHRLVIAGTDAGEADAIRAAAGEAPLELTGYVPDARLDALMRGADVLVHPSLYEGFGLVLVEAMARDVPVASANTTALPETAGDAAEYFDPLVVADIAEAIRRALGRRDELVAAGRARVAELSWERAADATVAVYREAAGQ